MTLGDAVRALSALAVHARAEVDVPTLVEDAAELRNQQATVLEALLVAQRAAGLVSHDGSRGARETWNEASRVVTRLRVQSAELAMREALLLSEVERELYWARTRQVLAHEVAA